MNGASPVASANTSNSPTKNTSIAIGISQYLFLTIKKCKNSLKIDNLPIEYSLSSIGAHIYLSRLVASLLASSMNQSLH